MEEKKEHHSEHHEHQAHHKKKIEWMKIGTIVGIIAAIAIVSLFILLAPKIKTGSAISLQYEIALANGTVIANGTENMTVGEISSNFGFLSNKTDEKLIGLEKGKEIKINLSAKEAVGERNESLVYAINRTEKQNRTVNISYDKFTGAFNETPVINKTFVRDQDPFNYTVIKVDSANVTLKMTLNATQTISLATANMTISQDENYVYYRFDTGLGENQAFGGNVVAINENSITMDGNNPFAGKDLVLTLKVLSIENPATISNPVSVNKNSGPLMQVFIMSHCPYGVQMLKGMLPAWKLLGDKANFELRFVSYTMHGAQEELDNKRIICIREEQNDKLIDYLNCFAYADGTEAGAKSCISKTGIDETSLDSCVSSKADGYMADDKALNTKYGVQGSPTVVINGKTASISRDPESVKQAICKAFTSEPSECSQTLSSASPSAGFGGPSASSSSSATCA